MLKYEHIPTGTRIRAYDFEPIPGRSERYVEGVVIGHRTMTEGWKALVVVADVDSAFPDPDYTRVGLRTYVPMETSMDYDGRVVILKSWEERMCEERCARFVA